MGHTFSSDAPERETVPEFVVNRFTEQSAPTLAIRAREILAQSYLHEGYVTAEACDGTGHLRDDVDSLRGPGVDYWLVDRPAAAGLEQASGRRIRARHSLDELPGYVRCNAALSPWALDLLDDRPPHRVAELGAFARTPASPRASLFALMAAIVQDVIVWPTEDVWLVTTTPRLLRTLHATFGPEVVRIAGDPIPSRRVNGAEVELVPAVVEPHRILSTLTLTSVSNDHHAPHRLRALRTLTSGLDSMFIPSAARALLSRSEHVEAPEAHR